MRAGKDRSLPAFFYSTGHRGFRADHGVTIKMSAPVQRARESPLQCAPRMPSKRQTNESAPCSPRQKSGRPSRRGFASPSASLGNPQISNRHSLPLIATEGSLGGERTLPTVAIAEGARPRIRAHRGWGWAGNRWGGLCRAGPWACSCNHLSILGGLRLPVLRLRLWLSLLWLPLRLLLVSRLGSGTACRGGSDCASRNRPQCGYRDRNYVRHANYRHRMLYGRSAYVPIRIR
jgi:hypothetical protein